MSNTKIFYVFDAETRDVVSFHSTRELAELAAQKYARECDVDDNLDTLYTFDIYIKTGELQ